MFIICDESTQGNSSVMGGISINVTQALEFENLALQKRYEEMVFGEIKWEKLKSKGKYYDFYLELIKLFFSNTSARFHSNSYTGNQYKVGYLLVRSISWKLQGISLFPQLNILFDSTQSIGAEEVKKTRFKLGLAYSSSNGSHNVYHKIRMCNQTDSHIINLGQVADLLTGAVAYKIGVKEGAISSNDVRDEFIKEIEKLDNNNDITFSIPGKLWGYNEKKIQHYNLHLA